MSLTLRDVDRRIQHALKKLGLMIEIVHAIDLQTDGTGEGEGTDEAEVEFEVAGFGHLRSRPRKGAAGVSIKVGGEENTTILLGYQDREFEWTDIDYDESVLENAAGAKLHFQKTGKVTLDAEATQDVVVNGGNKKASKVGDTVLIGTLAVANNTLTFTPVDADGNPLTPIGPAASVVLSGFVANAGGAPRLKI